jgi:hypothetical protein
VDQNDAALVDRLTGWRERGRWRRGICWHGELLRSKDVVTGGGWQPRVAGGGRDLTRSSMQPSTQSSILRNGYVVTRSRPYLARRSRERLAVGGWRLGAQRDGLGQHAVLPLPCFAAVPPCQQFPLLTVSTLTQRGAWAEWRGVLKTTNKVSNVFQRSLKPGSIRA